MQLLVFVLSNHAISISDDLLQIAYCFSVFAAYLIAGGQLFYLIMSSPYVTFFWVFYWSRFAVNPTLWGLWLRKGTLLG